MPPAGGEEQRHARLEGHLGGAERLGAGRVDELCDGLRETLDAHPAEGAGLFSLLASAELARGRTEAAEAALRSYRAAAPSPQAAVVLAEFLHRVGRTREGATLLEEEWARLGDAAGPRKAA